MGGLFLQPGDSTLLDIVGAQVGVTLPAALGVGRGLEVLSYNLGSAHMVGGPAPSIGELSLSRHVDAFSVRLQDLCMRAKPLGVGAEQPTLLKVLYQQDQQVLTLALRDAIVTTVQTGGVPGNAPVENVALSFTEILWTHATLAAEGNPASQFSSGWSIKLNRPIAAFSA